MSIHQATNTHDTKQVKKTVKNHQKPATKIRPKIRSALPSETRKSCPGPGDFRKKPIEVVAKHFGLLDVYTLKTCALVDANCKLFLAKYSGVHQ